MTNCCNQGQKCVLWLLQILSEPRFCCKQYWFESGSQHFPTQCSHHVQSIFKVSIKKSGGNEERLSLI